MDWIVIEIDSGECVGTSGEPTGGTGAEPALFDTEDAAQAWAMAQFGPDAGKRYRVEAVA